MKDIKDMVWMAKSCRRSDLDIHRYWSPLHHLIKALLLFMKGQHQVFRVFMHDVRRHFITNS